MRYDLHVPCAEVTCCQKDTYCAGTGTGDAQRCSI